jgi:hypothetical protein
MGRPRHRARNLTLLQTYAELTPYTQAFGQGKLKLLCLIGAAVMQFCRRGGEGEAGWAEAVAGLKRPGGSIPAGFL